MKRALADLCFFIVAGSVLLLLLAVYTIAFHIPNKAGLDYSSVTHLASQVFDYANQNPGFVLRWALILALAYLIKIILHKQHLKRNLTSARSFHSLTPGPSTPMRSWKPRRPWSSNQTDRDNSAGSSRRRSMRRRIS